MARPPIAGQTMRQRTVCLALPRQTWAHLDDLMARKQQSANDLIRVALLHYLARDAGVTNWVADILAAPTIPAAVKSQAVIAGLLDLSENAPKPAERPMTLAEKLVRDLEA